MKLNIYKASAGSGKTHILAGNYIVEAFAKKSPPCFRLSLYEAFSDTMAFARILAVTFTNKAAGEMKERILKELDKLSSGNNSDYVDDIIKRYPQYTPDLVAVRARKIRSTILHNYSDFNLKTIDSFVQRIVRAFCYDINQNSGFSIQTDENLVLNDLINMLLKKSDDSPELRELFLSMAQKNVRDGVNWDFRDKLKSLARLIFTEKFKVLEKFQNEMDEITRKKYFSTAHEIINIIYDDFETKCNDISKRAKAIFNEIGISIDELGRNIGTLYRFLTANLTACEIKPTIEKLANDEGWLKSKPTKIQLEYVPILQQKLMPLLEEALKLIHNDSVKYLTAKVIRKEFYAYTLMGDLARLLPEYRHENRMMLVSDATSFLNDIVANNDAPFIYERVGNKFDHVYIDEFQDTSEFQWNNFRPLIENTIAQGFDNMIVGDVKQSIYRFRGGDWSLLNNIVRQQIGDDNINLNTLDTNWRSRKNIVDFNNAIFKKSVNLLAKFDSDNLDFNILNDIYSDSFQKLPTKFDRSGGKVNVMFFKNSKEENSESDDSDNKSENTAEGVVADNEKNEDLILPDTNATNFEIKSLNRMAQEIDNLLRKGVSAKKICILVRKGNEGNLCVNFLMKYQKCVDNSMRYDIVSSDALYVRNSLAVMVLLNAMKFVNNSSDIIAKVEMLRAYCRISGMKIADDDILKSAVDANPSIKILPESFNEIQKSYSDLPLYDLCEKIVACFQLQQYEGDAEYLRTFEDCVLDFTKNFSSDLNRFVNWWTESGYNTAIQPSDNQDAITVMTIHKSKGLDFCIQFIPFCDWAMVECNNLRPNYILVESPDSKESADFHKLGVVPVAFSTALANTFFADSYKKEKLNMYLDSLNLLYVALTRAVDELHIYCPLPKDNLKNIGTVGDLLYCAISEDSDNQSDGVVDLSKFFRINDSELVMDQNHFLKPDVSKEIVKDFKLSTFNNELWQSKLRVKSHSSNFFIQDSTFLQDRINHGLLMHDIMSRIQYRDDVPFVLQDMKNQGLITEQQRQQLIKMLDNAFQNPQVARWFSHEWKQIFNERALLNAEGDIRIPDRVLSSDNETIVIDFKFGNEHEKYRDQIAEYANLLREMKYPNISAFLFYVMDGKIVEIK